MKKTLLTFAFGMLLQMASAQEAPSIPACVIINAGMNMASLQDYDYFFLSKANPGFSGGAMVRSGDDFFFTAGLQYIVANPTITSRDDAATDNVSFQFLQLPVMVGMHIVKSPDNKRTLHAQLGPTLNALLGVSQNSLGITKDAINNTFFNIKAGAGVDLWMFTFDINYNLLLSNLYSRAGYNNEAHLKCWEFSVGYKIYNHKGE